MDTVYKAGHQSSDDAFDFVLSDESVDRMGDVIRAKGWSLSDFQKNPVALFAHDHMLPIGVWKNVRVEGKRLLGTLKLAKHGTSELIDTIRSLLEQKMLNAVSVGFQPIEAEPRKGGGYEFTKASLHEVSLVAVPANPQAIALAKSLSPEVATQLFVKPDAADSIFTTGQSTHSLKTPNLDAARIRLKALGID